MNFEYVISGLTMGIDDLYYNPKTAEPYIHRMNEKVIDMNNKYDNQKVSLLFNAYTEKKHGITMNDTMLHSWHRLFADSGGLQLARTPRGITPELKDKVYRHQAKYCDVAMIFDELPVEYDLSLTGGATMKSTSIGRRFNRSDIKRSAIETRENVKRQIEVFKEEDSKAKIMLISQGQDVESFREYIEIICNGLDNEDIETMCCGVAPSSQGIGNHFIHRMEMIYSIREYQIPNCVKKNIHLLGVGSVNALMPFVISPEFFDFVETVSFDSSTHASAWFFSKYRDKNYKQCQMEIPRSSKKSVADQINILLPIVEDIMNDHREVFNEFNITDPMKLIDTSTKWSVDNKDKERKFMKPGGAPGYHLLVWYWTMNNIVHFMDELNRRIEKPYDERGLNSIKNYDDFQRNWLPRQRGPSKVQEHWPVRLDV